jgi:hypothetical protein
VLLLVGDFNSSIGLLQIINTLSHIVDAATRGVDTLEMCFTSQPDLFKCSLLSASVLSDHRALIICGIINGMIFDAAKP